jgi:aryl-alcohol dehydrogenase-like predicted oxidoreductase
MSGQLILGVGSLHHLPYRAQRLRFLHHALDVGFRSFDVAPAYGNGLNELDLGLAIRGRVTACQITTKFGIPVDLYGERHPHLFFLLRAVGKFGKGDYGSEYTKRIFCSDEMVRSLEGSLRRLRREYIDDFMVHEPLGMLTKDQILDLHQTASRLKEQGKILRWGVCGPATSIHQFMVDPMVDVFQFPLEDLEESTPPEPRRRIAYGVHRSYLSSSSFHTMSFYEFVAINMKSLPVNLIVGTTSCKKLTPFRECLQ